MTDQEELTYKQLAERAVDYRDRGAKLEAARLFALAGEQAAKQNANKVAIDYHNMALSCTPESNLAQWYRLILRREKLFDRLGNREKQQEDLVTLAVLADVLDDDAKRAEAAGRQADYRLNIGDFEMALTVIRMSTRMAQIAAAPIVEANGRIIWGKALLRQGEESLAKTQLQKALQLTKMHPEAPETTADAHRALGVLLLEMGTLADAQTHFKEAMAIYEQLGDRFGLGRALNNLGTGAYRQGQWGDARHYWEKALPIYKQVADRSGKSMIHNNLGSLAMDTADYDQARIHFETARDIADEIMQRFGKAISLLNLGLVQLKTGQLESALDYGRQALAMGQKLKSKRLEGYAWATLAQIHEAQAQWDDAQAAYWQSLGIWQEMDHTASMMAQNAGLARVALAQQKLTEALHYCNDILLHLATGGNFNGVENPASIYLSLYQVLATSNDPRAGDIIQQAYDAVQQKAMSLDSEARDAFLQQVSEHRAIIAAYEETRAK